MPTGLEISSRPSPVTSRPTDLPISCVTSHVTRNDWPIDADDAELLRLLRPDRLRAARSLPSRSTVNVTGAPRESWIVGRIESPSTLLAVDREDPVARLHAGGFRGRVGEDVVDRRADAVGRAAKLEPEPVAAAERHEERGEDRDGEQEVRRRPGEDDGDPLPGLRTPVRVRRERILDLGQPALGRPQRQRRQRRLGQGRPDTFERRARRRRSRSPRDAAAGRRPAGRAAAPPRPRGRSGRRGRPPPAGACPGSSRSRRAGSRRRRTRSRSASSSRSPAGSRGRTCAGSSRRRGRRRSGPPRGSGSGTRARGARRRCSCDRASTALRSSAEPRAHSPQSAPRRARLEVARGRSVRGRERVLDDLRDPEERQPAVEERGDRDLVGRVEDARVGPAGLARRGARARAAGTSPGRAPRTRASGPRRGRAAGTSVAARSG